MPAPPFDRDFRRRFALRDGTTATIRVMRPDDRQRLEDAFSKLEPHSVYVRFFSFRKELPESALQRIAKIDFVHLLGLVVTIGEGGDENVIGSTTYVGDDAPDGEREAEIAFTVEEDYQGQGLAGRLLETAADIARRHGIVRLTAEVLAENRSMLRVFQRSGLPMRRHREDGVFHVELDLGAPAA
jgi:RimJ/RimL family protein N-acetyltransferase